MRTFSVVSIILFEKKVFVQAYKCNSRVSSDTYSRLWATAEVVTSTAAAPMTT